MGRLNGQQLEAIKKKLGVDRIWSFSKMSTYEQCSWSYKLKYIDKLRKSGDSCYTYWGTISHEIRQDFYDGVYKTNQEMVDKLEEEILTYYTEDKKELKFPHVGEDENYFNNLRHYFANCTHVPVDVKNEKIVISLIKNGDKKYAFQGYIDSFYELDGKYYILDYKTSSFSGFSGDKLMEKSQQLMIYAYGLWKMQGIPIEQIVLRFDMMKYCHVSFMQKNGKIKTTRADRRAWVVAISNQMRKDFENVEKDIAVHEKKIATLSKKMSAKCRTAEEVEGLSVEIGEIESQIQELLKNVYDFLQVNEMVSEAMDNNDLSNMPQFIQDKYTLEDCYVDVELNEEIITEFIKRIEGTLDKIVEAECEDAEQSFARNRIEDSESYFCNNLCDVRENCKYYSEYREHLTMFLSQKEESQEDSDDVMMKMLGLA